MSTFLIPEKAKILIMLKTTQTPIQVLFTRQHHEADVAGPHKDYRIVIKDKAYSFATKKMELPEPGASVILYEQPVHDATYALSKKVEIPKGSYGAGTTTLDWVRKAELKEGDGYFTLTTKGKDGEKYLLKHLPQYEGGKSWLFKNLTKKEPMENKYIKQIEKEASLLVGTALGHLTQNALTGIALRSKRGAQYLANHFATGVQGAVPAGRWNKAKEAFINTAVPDLGIASRAANAAGQQIKDVLPNISKRSQVALRMLSQGRFKDIHKYGYADHPAIHHVLGMVGAHHGVDLKGMLNTGNAEKLEQVFHSKKYPLLSTVLNGISKGKAHKVRTTGVAKPTSGVLGGAAMAAIEPGAGMMVAGKHLASSTGFQKTRLGGWFSKQISDHLVKDPAKKGWEQGSAYVERARNLAYEHLVNPTSAHLHRTAAAISSAVSGMKPMP